MNKELLERYIIGGTNEVENMMVQEWLDKDANNRVEYLKMKEIFQSYLYAMNKELLERYIVGESNEAERLIVQEWLDKDANNREAYLKMKKLWDSLPKPVEVPDVDVDKAWGDFKAMRDKRALERSDIPNKKTKVIQWNWWAAASVLILCALGFYLFDRAHRETMLLSSHDVVRKDSLPDGSVVTLNRNTELAYSSAWTSTYRNVALKQGEVFFQVHKDQQHPFVIETGKSKITVLGTSFNVRRMSNATEVIVSTGLVRVNYGNKEVLLRPEQMITIRDSDTTKAETKRVKDQFYKYYVDRELLFENTPLQRVVEVLERAYGYKIEIDHPADRKLLLTATFEQNSLTEILKVLRDTFALKIVAKDKEIHLTR
ncbi:FecR domain-containing protein [Sphingobacterium sp. N143]|uniref:FecR family protein n=1 Tax=Sphingobacterium sp. N143 TaxID=2746727 RepID=UPI0025774948|nr:FecR domain-containing protein [Sphingobacterium sp. N143]MDM1295192.1 FecR domain-containing protein [Sphingobacterium sp. N143]